MLELVTTVLECLGFALIIAGVGVTTAVMVTGGLGVGLGLAASGLSALALSGLTQAAVKALAPDGRRKR